LLTRAKAAAPINEICGGDGGRDEEVGVVGDIGVGRVGDDGGSAEGVGVVGHVGDGWVGVGKDSVIEGAIDVRGLSEAGVRKVSRLNSQSIGGL
jgi:hypothetical protein